MSLPALQSPLGVPAYAEPSYGSVSTPNGGWIGPIAAPRQVGRFQLARFVGLFWIPLLALALRLASTPTASAAYVLIAVYALAGPRQAIVSLWLCWVFNMLNHGLFPPPSSAAFLRHAIVLAAFLSVLVHGRAFARRQTGWLGPSTILLCLFLLVHSAIFSQQMDVSVLKAVSFTMTVLAALIGWASLTEADRRETERFVFGSLAGIAVASVPLIPLRVGYFRNGLGFQGVMVHPQNFGPSIAVLAVLLIALGLTNRRIRLWHAVLLGICLFSVYLSKARVGATALAAGLVLGLVGEWFRAAVVRFRAGKDLRTSRVLTLAFLVILAVTVGGPWIVPEVRAFFDKGSRSDSIYEAAMRSRGRKLEEMLKNFREHPFAGVGFGTDPKVDYYGLARDPIFGLPVMATVEKGVMPVAVLEETGFLGAVFTYPWLLLLIIRSIRGGILAGSVCWAVLVTNIAEACLFSPGGQGMFQLILAMWAATARPWSPPAVRHAADTDATSLLVRTAA